MFYGVGQTPGAYGPQQAYRDGVLGQETAETTAPSDATEAASDADDKKKMLLYGGIAVGVIAIGAVVYFARKR
jgi:hypothetical protein